MIDNPDKLHTFNCFEEKCHAKRYKCHFRLTDPVRGHLYYMGGEPLMKSRYMLCLFYYDKNKPWTSTQNWVNQV